VSQEWNDTATLSLERPTLTDFLALTKPGLSLFSVATAVAGAFLAAEGALDIAPFLVTLLGTFLAASGAVTLNQYGERIPDARMHRTANRPLPRGRIQPTAGLIFGLMLCLSGFVVLSVGGDILAGGIALATVAIYLLLYTPLKRLTPLATPVGAIAGALPPIVGWAVVRHDLAPEAWTLFAVLFIWQMPHFFALALMYRDDYARAGFKNVTTKDPTGRRTVRHILFYSATLLPVSLLPSAVGLLGLIYAIGAVIVAVIFFVVAARLFQRNTQKNARTLFLTSLAYLPVLSVLMVADRLLAFRF
jgi:protoheme IX farnesyltransferase